MTAHTAVFELRATIARPPASVEKLYTSVAALRVLGSGAQLLTAVMGAGHLGPDGVWHGDLYLHGGGDPTFGDGGFNHVWEQGYGPTAAQLVSQLRDDGIRRVTGSVIADASLFDDKPGGPATGYAPDVPDYGGRMSALTYDHGSTTAGWSSPATFAAHELAIVLRASGVWALAARKTGVTPSGARLLASVSSPPLQVLLKLMDVPSDDLFADLLTKQLGVQSGAGGSLAAGAQVIAGQIAAYGLHPAIVDGSGLSRADHSSPSEVVALLRAVWATPVGKVLRNALPVVGPDRYRRVARGRDAGSGPLHRQDRHPRRRHEPSRLLPHGDRAHAGVRLVHRRPGQLAGVPDRQQGGRGNRALLVVQPCKFVAVCPHHLRAAGASTRQRR